MNKYSSDGAPWMRYKGSITSLVIKSGVKRVGDYAFYGCSQMTSATLCSTLDEIGNYAFYRSGITSISVPSSVDKISEYAFSQSALSTAWISAKKIGKNAFRSCSSLTSAALYNSVQEIEDSAFRSCSKLSSVSIPSRVDKIDSYAFAGCTSLRSLQISSGVNVIESYAFSSCSNLTLLNLPNTIYTIENGAFSGCSKLSEVNISSGLTALENYVFSGCRSLKSITIPAGVRTIGQSTFSGCSELTEVSISQTVKTIQDSAFSNCSKLKKVIYFGDGDPSSGDPFKGCSALEYVCVSTDYQADKFCQKTVYPHSTAPELAPILAEENQCYQPMICSETYGVVVERLNATEWNNQVSSCSTFYCDNQTGGEFYSKCNTSATASKICLRDMCVSNTSVKSQGWTVVLNFLDVNASELNKTEFLDDCHSISGVDSIVLATEIDNEGFLERIYLIVGSEYKAEKLMDKLQDAIAESTCKYGILCEAENMTIVAQTVYSAASHSYESILFLFFALIISVFTLY